MKINKVLLISLSVILFFGSVSTAIAAGGLAQLVDMINTYKPNAPSEHQISFILPSDSLPVFTTDWIHLYFALYEVATPPAIFSGSYAGIPVVTMEDKWIHITGIALQPGGFMGIHNIGTINPGTFEEHEMSLFITQDYERTVVKNGASTKSNLFRGQVSVTAYIQANLATLQISGYSSPNTYVIFSEANAVIGTDVAGPSGYFSKIFSGLQPTTHQISFYGIDTSQRTTSPVVLEIYTPGKALTSVSNQLLSPTIELLSNQLTPTQDLIASGSAYPNTNITLFTDAPLRSYYSTVDSAGFWTYTINDIDEYILGDYLYYGLVQTGIGLQSLLSNSQLFSIKSTNATGTKCGDISQGDLNCDNFVDLTDFSILMYYWGTANAAADINTDLSVNLTDFSIMMYYWGT
jgi:hypothetical protein